MRIAGAGAQSAAAGQDAALSADCAMGLVRPDAHAATDETRSAEKIPA